MKKNRVIIAGSRSCPETSPILIKKVLSLMNDLPIQDTEIVSGACRGADKLGENIASSFGYALKKFPADWDLHGKSAGPIRNKEMAMYSTHLIALWDGESNGTKGMISLARANGLEVRVINLKRDSIILGRIPLTVDLLLSSGFVSCGGNTWSGINRYCYNLGDCVNLVYRDGGVYVYFGDREVSKKLEFADEVRDLYSILLGIDIEFKK